MGNSLKKNRSGQPGHLVWPQAVEQLSWLAAAAAAVATAAAAVAVAASLAQGYQPSFLEKLL